MLWLRRIGRGLAVTALILLVLLLAWAGWVLVLMQATVPQLDGRVSAPVSAPVEIVRDAAGVPTISGATRADVAWGLGFLHGQERYFQMDTLRRTAAGEMGGLLGGVAREGDLAVRVHRFRDRARAIVARMTPAERRLIDAYVAGVNAGREGLGWRPWEYGVLLTAPEPWTAEDSLLTIFAMYLNLQPAVPRVELDRAVALSRGGQALAEFLFPLGGPIDAALDGSRVADPPMPLRIGRQRTPAIGPSAAPDPQVPGSNNWAVAGRLSTSGAALVANDMHLGVATPNIWYRARMIVTGAGEAMDVAGVTLPGTPQLTQGSNGRIAWGFTNSYIDSADAVIVEPVAGRDGWYRTTAGPREIVRVPDRWCGRFGCEALNIEETIWGPITGTDALGRRIAMRWTAHSPVAIRIAPQFALERASSVAEAIAIAHVSGIPQQNFTVGDRAGTIGWTIIGQVPARYGWGGRDAVSFADGRRGWRGMVAPGAVPVLIDPPSGRIWTANNRIVGGGGLATLGDGNWAGGERAGRIRDRLFARDRFTPADFLSIQLDDANPRNRWWRAALLRELGARRDDPALSALIPVVRAAGVRALPEDRGYWLVAEWRAETIARLYAAYLGKPDSPRRLSYAGPRSEQSVRRLLTERPGAMIPPGHRDWRDFLDGTLASLATRADGGDDPRGFLSGGFSRADVVHPLSRLISPVGWIANPRDATNAGEASTVRARGRGFGASQRSAVSPGYEADGLMHMPGSQAGNPRAPYYLAGHDGWLEGRPAPFLPGPPRWRLTIAR